MMMTMTILLNLRGETVEVYRFFFCSVRLSSSSPSFVPRCMAPVELSSHLHLSIVHPLPTPLSHLSSPYSWGS